MLEKKVQSGVHVFFSNNHILLQEIFSDAVKTLQIIHVVEPF